MTGMMGMCLTTMTNRLTDREKDTFVEMVGGTDVVRQIRRGEMHVRLIKVGGKNETTCVLGGLLEEDDETFVFPAAGRLVVREEFKEDRDGEIPISAVHGASVEDFLDIIEEGAPIAVLKRRKLLERSRDMRILFALGIQRSVEVEKVRVAVAHIKEFLKTADRLQWFHFFFGAKLMSMIIHWDGYGWDFEVIPISYPREREIGDYVVSP